MADLSLLMGRGNGRFAIDARFDGAGVGAEVEERAPDPIGAAHTAAFAEGLAAGRAEALAEIAADHGFRDQLSFSFTRLDSEMAELLRQRLLATVQALCEATLAPLALDMPALAERVARAAALFLRADDERVIRLNPEDLAAVQPMLPTDWVFAADPALARGALRVETHGGGAEDGPEQWRRAIAEALDPC